MLNKKRVLHMTRMEMHRQKEAVEIAPFINVDKRDYLSFVHVTGFLIGSVFYALVLGVILLVVYGMLLTNLSRAAVILTVILAVIGYIVFLFLYQSWAHRRAMLRLGAAKRKINRLRRDWSVLEEIYRQEEEAAKPTVDMDVLFPEGSLGENG